MSKLPTSVLTEYLADRNFQKWHTGGGCYALVQPYDDGDEYDILITDSSGCNVPDDAEDMIIGLYRVADNEPLAHVQGNLNQCMHFLEYTAREVIGELECDHANIQFHPDEYDAEGNRVNKHHWVCPDCGYLQVG